MPRTPTYGRAAGPGDAVGSSIYELYAPQRESTKFGVDYAKTGYQLQKEVEIEKQKQLDAQIAQNKRVRDIQEQEAEKRRAKGRRGQKVGTAAAGAYTGAKWGAVGGVPGSIVGGLIGGVGGWLFGEDGGMVPSIHPDSLLYKQYQGGGGVTGYSGGQPKFLRRGYQNLQLREEDVERAQENLESVKAYNFWDAIGDIGAGLDVGKSLYGQFGDYAKILGSGIGKEGGLTRAWDIIKDLESGKSTPGGEFSAIPEILPFEPEPIYNPGRLSLPTITKAGGGYVPTPARNSIYRDQVRATKYLK